MIHREGRGFLALVGAKFAIIVFAVMWIWPEAKLAHYTLLFLALGGFLFFLQFFRNPKRKISKDDSLVLAPADGKVVVIEKTEDTEYLKGERIQVSIFMSPLNVHVNRNPVTGILKYFKYHPGKYLVAWHPKSSTENERTTLVYELKSGVEILIRQIAGMAARRIKWYVKENDALNQGQEFGFIKFGSRVDIFLPPDADVLVKIGDKPRGGQTPIARLT